MAELDVLSVIGVGLHGHAAVDPFKVGKGKKHPLPEEMRNAEAMSEYLVQHARTVYLEGERKLDTALKPMVIACCANGDVMPMVHGDSFGEEQKDQWATICRRLFKEWNVRHYGMITEAWLAVPRPEELTRDGKLKPDALMPSERTDRREVVFISAADTRDRVFMRSLEIVRDEKGYVVDLTDMADEMSGFGAPGTDVSKRYKGRFRNFLVPEQPIFEKPTHPCADPEHLRQLESTVTVLSSVNAMRDKFGLRADEFEARAAALLGETGLAWDRLASTSVDKLMKDDRVYQEYAATGLKTQQFLLDMSEFFSPETREALRTAMMQQTGQQAPT